MARNFGIPEHPQFRRPDEPGPRPEVSAELSIWTLSKILVVVIALDALCFALICAAAVGIAFGCATIIGALQ